MTSSIDLKSIRESVTPEVTQTELGRRLGKDQAQISRWESDPSGVPLGVVQDICDALGVDMAAALADTRGPGLGGLDVGDPYAPCQSRFARLSAALRQDTGRDLEVLDTLPYPMPTRARVHDGLLPLVRKPLLGVFGAFDAGKSTLLNSLLGQEALPTGYAPLTRIPMYVRHVDDRPTWMREDEAWLYRAGWDPSRWQDEGHCNECRVVAGGKTTLEEHASHRGSRSLESDAVMATLYLDAPLLRACDLLDSPGYDNDAIDDGSAQDSITRVDVAIYCSPYIGFMNASDILRAGRLIRTLPDLELPGQGPLANLFFVATHARAADPSDKDLEDIFESATQRCWRIWSGTLLEELAAQDRQHFHPSMVRDRFFTYSKQSDSRSNSLVNAVSSLLTHDIPEVHQEVADYVIDSLRTAVDEAAAQTLDEYASLRHSREEAEAELEWLLDHEAERQSRVKAARKDFHAYVARARRTTKADFGKKAETITTEKHVRAVVDSFDGRKEAQKGVLGVIVEELQSAADRVCTRESESVKEQMAAYFAAYQDHIYRPGRVSTPFNIEGAFLGGLAGLGGVGALALWASSLGNLGGYILAAKFTSVLAALGISISGGTATVVSALAAVGGPVTVAVAIVAVAILAGFALFGSSWQSRLTKKAIGTLKGKKVVPKIKDQIDTFWDNTLTAFDQGADAVEEEYQAHLDELAHRANDITDEEIATVIENTSMARAWYASLPW